MRAVDRRPVAMGVEWESVFSHVVLGCVSSVTKASEGLDEVRMAKQKEEKERWYVLCTASGTCLCVGICKERGVAGRANLQMSRSMRRASVV